MVDTATKWATANLGVELPEVSLSFLHAHRGELGFDIIEPRGSLVSFDLLVPVVRFLDVSITAGYLYATRRASGADRHVPSVGPREALARARKCAA